MNIEMLTGYYGLDWLAMGLTVGAIFMLGNHRRRGFVVMTAGNFAWIAAGLIANSLAMVAANAIFIVLNIRGYLKWGRDNKSKHQ